MEKLRIWYGARNWLLGDENCEFYEVEFTGGHLGEWKILTDDVGNRGVTYRVYRTLEGGVLIHSHSWTRYLNEYHFAYIDEYESLDAAAEDGFADVLMKMRVLDLRTYEVENWRKAWREKNPV